MIKGTYYIMRDHTTISKWLAVVEESFEAASAGEEINTPSHSPAVLYVGGEEAAGIGGKSGLTIPSWGLVFETEEEARVVAVCAALGDSSVSWRHSK